MIFSNKSKEILKKTSKLSFFILLNKPIGLLRDILQTRYFGLDCLADAYTIAWRIPNMFRRILGEGLLTNTLLPDLVKIEKNEPPEILEEVITTISFIMQVIITILCICISYNSLSIITFLSPGAISRILYASEMLRVLSFFTFFMTFSSILGIAIQLKKNFYIGPQSQFILNIFFCIELFLAQKYNFSYFLIAILITLNGIIILLVHFYAFFYYNYQFRKPSKKSISYTQVFLKKFFIGLSSALLLEANTFINISISSYLLPGMLSLIEILNTLIRLPLQVFGSSISTTSNLDIIKSIQENNNQETKNIVYQIFYIFLIISSLTSFFIYFFGNYFFNIFFYLTNIKKINIQDTTNLFFILSLSLFPALANKILINIFYAKEKIFITVIIYLLINILQNISLSFFILKYQLLAFIIIYVLVEWIRFLILFFWIKIFFKIPLYKRINR